MQLKQHGGGKELEGWDLPARAAGFTALPFSHLFSFLREGLSLSLALCSHSAQSGSFSGDLLKSPRAALSSKVVYFSLESHLLCFTSCPSKSPWDPGSDTHRATAALQVE